MEDKKLEKCEAKHELKKLKQEYEVLRKKYSLPEFKFMNETFEIETIPSEETELFIKRIRKNITEKISSGLRAMEMFLNPQPTPIFLFKIIKSFSQDDKAIIEELYYKFTCFEIEAFGLENEYNEKKEIEFIKQVAKDWPEISSNLDKIYKSMKLYNTTESKKSEKSYFG